MSVIPTSNLELFHKQVSNPNVGFDTSYDPEEESKKMLHKVKKNIVLSYVSDYTGCGHIRNILPATYLNAIFGRDSQMNIITSPTMIFQTDILKRTRSIFFQRTMGPNSTSLIQQYKELQQQYQFKMVYDLDDFIWDGKDIGEEIPNYNFGKEAITHDVQQSAIDNMKMMDTVTVTCEFLKDYIASRGVDKNKIKIVHNTMPSFLWGTSKKSHITKKIKKPKIVWSASPTHWHDGKKLLGDLDNAWYQWILKAVKEDKIEYVQMGGLPWFFEEIKDKITVMPWVNSLHYPASVKSINADFGIAPLVPNFFNYSKSPIKYQEYCVSGIVGVGTVFTNGKPSPYDIALTQTPDNVTVEMLDHLFFEYLCLPENYNRLLDAQYQQVMAGGWLTESSEYVNLMTSIL
jgi:hypothetical protein